MQLSFELDGVDYCDPEKFDIVIKGVGEALSVPLHALVNSLGDVSVRLNSVSLDISIRCNTTGEEV